MMFLRIARPDVFKELDAQGAKKTAA